MLHRTAYNLIAKALTKKEEDIMKQNMIKLSSLLMCAALALSLGACSKPAEPEIEAGSYTAGTYTGEAAGMKGPIVVEVTFTDSEIKEVKVKEHNETFGIGYGMTTTPIEVLPNEIVETQSLNLDAITGATITSAAVKSAVAEAVKQAGADPEVLKAVPAVKDEAKDEVYDVDIVIAGGGVAGLSAGIEAAAQGAKVLIVEKQGIAGGTTSRSGGKLLASGTSWQTAQGFDDNPELMFEYLKSVGGDLLDDAKLMEFCNESVANLDWVAEQGVPVQDVEAIHSSLTPWRVHNVEGGGGMTNGHGGQIIVPLLDKFLSLGGEIIYNTAADELLVDENGLVSGLHALKSDGSNVTVNAQATILATGGFFQNKELMSRYPAAVNANTSAPKGNVGDGLKMAEKVGADVFMSNGVHIVFCNFASGVGINEEAGLIVNEEGKRFGNEYTYQYHVAKNLMDTGSVKGYYIAAENDPNKTVQYALALDSTLKSDSIEGLAELMGVDAETLRATVDRYNELCAAGNDEDFNKPADKMIPVEGTTYYALEMKPAGSVTYGGLVTDLDSRVLDKEGKPIDHLYAAGEVAFTGFFGEEYPCCGMAISTGVYMGRDAARIAVAELKK
ncbi:flavocytochrome c [Dielma fastidiosa]